MQDFNIGDKVVCILNQKYKGEVKRAEGFGTGSGMVVWLYDVYYFEPVKKSDHTTITGNMFFGWQLEKIREKT